MSHAGTNAERTALRERLAALEHEQWIEWSRTVAETEQLSSARLVRWQARWVPYAALNEADKDLDRAYADRILALLDSLCAKTLESRGTES